MNRKTGCGKLHPVFCKTMHTCLHCTALLCIVKINRKYTNEYEFKKTYEIKKKSDRDMA